VIAVENSNHNMSDWGDHDNDDVGVVSSGDDDDDEQSLPNITTPRPKAFQRIHTPAGKLQFPRNVNPTKAATSVSRRQSAFFASNSRAAILQ
jgi:hypothetical protein